MIHSPATVVAAFLVAGGLFGGVTAWTYSVGYEPDADGVEAEHVTLFDTAGLKDAKLLADGTGIYRHGLQCLVRSQARSDGWTKAEAILAALTVCRGRATTDQVTISATTYTIHNASQQGPTFSLGLDGAKRRTTHSLNFLMSIT